MPLVAGRPRRRRAAGPPQLQDPAHAGRPRPVDRRGHRLHPLPDRGLDRRRRGHHRRRRPRRLVARPPAAHRRRTRPCGAPSTASRSSARSLVAKGRSDGRTDRHRARDQGQPDHRASRCCTCGSTDRLPVADGPRRAARATATATAPSRTPSPRPSRPSATTCSATSPIVDLLTEPVYVLADRWRAETVERTRRRRRGRHRPGRGRPLPPRAARTLGADRAGLHGGRAARTPSSGATRPSATRRGSRPRRRS